MSTHIRLMDQARTYVLTFPGTLRDLADEADVGYEWLRKFKNDKIPSPGVDKIDKLLAHRNRAVAPLEREAV